MNRAASALFALILAVVVLAPATALAAEKAVVTSVQPTATAATIVYPEPEPDVSAEEAIATTDWAKPGDMLNLGVALIGFGGIIAVIVWGILASRRVTSA